MDYGTVMKAGISVELCPSTDRWMMGDRFGVTESSKPLGSTATLRDKDGNEYTVERFMLRVKMRTSGKTISISSDLVRPGY